MAVFWVVAPCSLVEVYQRFRGTCCLHHQGDGAPSSRKVAFNVTFLSKYLCKLLKYLRSDLRIPPIYQSVGQSV
jgi:hypothetical protein